MKVEVQTTLYPRQNQMIIVWMKVLKEFRYLKKKKRIQVFYWVVSWLNLWFLWVIKGQCLFEGEDCEKISVWDCEEKMMCNKLETDERTVLLDKVRSGRIPTTRNMVQKEVQCLPLEPMWRTLEILECNAWPAAAEGVDKPGHWFSVFWKPALSFCHSLMILQESWTICSLLK